MMTQERTENPLDTGTKHPENSGVTEPNPAKRQWYPPEQDATLIDDHFVQELYLHANNLELRQEYVQEINEFLSLAYQGTVFSAAEQLEVQKMLTPKIRDFFKKKEACRELLQEEMHKVCRVLGEKNHDKNPLELLYLLGQKNASAETSLREREYDSLNLDEESNHAEQKSSNQTVRAQFFAGSVERREGKRRHSDLYASFSNAIEKEKISQMSITEWCFQKEVFTQYVLAFPSRLCASRESHRDFLSQPRNLASSDYHLTDVFSGLRDEGLQSAVMQWEEQVENISSLYLNGVNFSQIPQDQFAKLKNQLVAITEHWEQITIAEEKEADMPVDRIKKIVMSQYLQYAQQVTELLHNDQSATPWVFQLEWMDAMNHAARSGHVSVTLLLLQFFFEYRERGGHIPDIFIENVDRVIEIVLMYAACNGRYRLLSVLLDKYEPDVHWRTHPKMYNKAFTGYITLLQIAAADGAAGTVRCILDYIEARGEIENTLEGRDTGACAMLIAAMYAAHEGNEKTFEVLLPYLKIHQVNCNTQGLADGETLLYHAVTGGRLNIVKTLVEELGANLNFMGQKNELPLFRAIEYEDLELVKYLIHAGVDIKAMNAKKETPLMSAARYNHIEITQLLVDAFANLSPENAEEKTAITIAREREDEVVAAHAPS